MCAQSAPVCPDSVDGARDGDGATIAEFLVAADDAEGEAVADGEAASSGRAAGDGCDSAGVVAYARGCRSSGGSCGG